MRTTIAIEDDVLAELRRRALERGESLAAAVNRALRRGLVDEPRPQQIEVPVHDMGVARVDLTKALSLAAELDDVEISRKLDVGK